MKKMVFSLLLLFFFIILSPWILLPLKDSKPFDFGPKRWIHHAGSPPNSLSGIETLLNKGEVGIEVDVFFIPEQNEFLLGHDWPLAKNAPRLSEVLERHQSTKMRLWLDYKNAELKHLGAAIKRIQELMMKHNFEDRYFIESPYGLHQVLLSWSGVNAVMWVRDFKKSRIGLLRRYLDRLFVAWGQFISVSMPHEAFAKVGASFDNQNLLIFTVNDQKMKHYFNELENVKVVLTDFEDLETTAAPGESSVSSLPVGLLCRFVYSGRQ